MNSINLFGPDGVVIDAGTYPTNPIALQWLDNCRRIVCCDGAANDFIARGGKPWRIVGDGDSLSEAIAADFSDIVRRIPDQETNDQTKAVGYLARHGCRKIVILGSTGKREDHTLGNVGLLTEYLRDGIEVRAYTDYGVFIPAHGRTEWACPTGTQVSVFNVGATHLRGEGLRYPLRDFDALWQGTLNETTGPHFAVDADGYYLLFINYPPDTKKIIK